ncbi:MAG: hypothetical protein ACRD24_01850, partial [Terriglobales bacterium]
RKTITYAIGIYVKLTTSFSIDSDLLREVKRSRRGHSTSQRVNELLRRALELERLERLELEAKEFFQSQTPAEREETLAFQAASLRSLTREP